MISSKTKYLRYIFLPSFEQVYDENLQEEDSDDYVEEVENEEEDDIEEEEEHDESLVAEGKFINR